MNDLPQPDTMPIDAWIAACCGQGQAPNGIDEAVALTQFMVGAYESLPHRAEVHLPQRQLKQQAKGPSRRGRPFFCGLR